MVLKFTILGIIILIFIIYELYFKEYFHVKKIFWSLKKFLSTRDTLILKIIPDVKDKKASKKIINLIEERRINFNSSYNNAIKSDVKLNSELINFYKKIDEERPNEVVLQVFAKIMGMEKDLKNIRNKYTLALEKYNESLIKHKFMCLKIIRMKPLDTYKVMK